MRGGETLLAPAEGFPLPSIHPTIPPPHPSLHTKDEQTTMSKMTESDIEAWLLELLQAQGYGYHAGPDIAPDGEEPLRTSWGDALLESVLREAVARLNPGVPEAAREDAVRQVKGVSSPELTSANETFHRLLTEGVPVSFRKDGEERGERVRLVDFDTPEANDFRAVNQLALTENGVTKRPDVVLFVNGLPLVVVELKNAADEKATPAAAFRQLQTYKATIPGLLRYNGLLVISDGLEARAGSLTADYERFMAWKSEDGTREAAKGKSQLEVLTRGLLNKKTLIDMIRFFTVFEKTKKEDESGQVCVRTSKKIAAYHQYYAVNKAIASTLRATREEGPERGKCGVVWHTQGSGKSLSMVFYTGKIVVTLNNPTVVVLTDRNDLDDQLFETFAAAAQLLRQEPKQADSRARLKELLKVPSGGIVFSTMQKFQPEEGNVFECLSERRNIIVMTDEAHRTQYGFKSRNVAVKQGGEVVGTRMVYGLAKYLRDALPNAAYMGFTGTPIESEDVNTPAVFGNYIDIYDIAQAVADGATVPIYYESRLAAIELPEEGKQLVRELDEKLDEEDPEQADMARAKRARLEALVGSRARLKTVARDIVTHFEARQAVFTGKGMIVCMSRPIAAALYEEIRALRPEWHDDDVRKGRIKVVMTAGSADGPELAALHTSKEERRALAERMKDAGDPLQLVIVCDMWLTGFDVPCLHTMYLDKPLRGHTLMQAIARVNRVYGDKPGGLIVDYLGIAADLKKALAFYGDAGGRGDPAQTQEAAVAVLLEKLDVVRAMLHGCPYGEYFTADTGRKLGIILDTAEFVLGLEDGKKRFLDAVRALSSAFALSVPHPQAMQVADEVGLFQAIRARLAKFDGGGSGGRSSVEMESAIRQVIDRALVSDHVVDIYDAAGIKKPDISILSDEFLQEIRGMERKNIALEVLKKLLNDELTGRARRNLIQSRRLLELLEDALKRYHNKAISAVEVLDELIALGKEVRDSGKEAEELNLTEYEYAFYLALAENNSARELMQQNGENKLRELAVVLTQKVRENATLDWTIKESVRAGLRVIIKRTLRKYGYPPDMELLATDRVMEQAQLIADELAG